MQKLLQNMRKRTDVLDDKVSSTLISYQEDDGGDCKARQGHHQVGLVIGELVNLVLEKGVEKRLKILSLLLLSTFM